MDRYSEILEKLKVQGNFRRIPEEAPATERIIDLSSNDYLGLASRQDLQERFFAEAGAKGLPPMTSSASRLLSGRQREYDSLEALLSQLYGRPCLLFNSGYHANTGMMQALAEGRTLIVADRLVHASIIDGITLSKARFTRFRHNDCGHLEKILAKESGDYERVLIVVESVYSMDGDRADIDALVDLKRRYPNALLYVDEAHAFGVEGPRGLGLALGSKDFSGVDVVMGTFGKACASFGAFCAVSPLLRDYLVNRARSLIFSTSLPPMSVAWTQFMIENFLDMDREREHLRALGEGLQGWLQPMSPHFPIVPSHIQPLVTGSAERAVSLSHQLREEGFKVLPIRTPTVPPGTERLRISLSAAISPEEIDRLGETITKLIMK